VTSDGGTGAKRNLMEGGVQAALETVEAGGRAKLQTPWTIDGRLERGDWREKATRD
jgi:hypothetical protein